MDIAAIIGSIMGVAFILVGQAMEGGNIGQLLQITAAFIVLGGSAGAVVMSFPVNVMATAIALLKDVFGSCEVNFDELIAEIIKFAQKARKEGIISLEKEIKSASDPLLITGMEAVSDGIDPVLVREMMENQIAQFEAKIAGGAKFWESFGGYTPTLGIVGAVLGLIQVMQNLNDPSKLGAGIAVAFVATIYGLIAANLFFIPFSSRIKFKYQKIFIKKEMIVEGVLAIQSGESPTLIERKLKSFLIDVKTTSEES